MVRIPILQLFRAVFFHRINPGTFRLVIDRMTRLDLAARFRLCKFVAFRAVMPNTVLMWIRRTDEGGVDGVGLVVLIGAGLARM